MTLSPIPVEKFGSLNLLDDPGEVGWGGAVDLLNVDFDQRGRLRTRDGYAKFTAAAGGGRYTALAPFYTTNGNKLLMTVDSNGGSTLFRAINTTGASVATSSFFTPGGGQPAYGSMVRWGSPGNEHMYLAHNVNGVPAWRWDGSVFTTTPGYTGSGVWPTGWHLAVQTTENRLVNARLAGAGPGNNISSVLFSDPGNPLNCPANNFVELNPGDGEEITGLFSWRELVFAFKETKFFVFHGNSTDGAGNPIFNYRPVHGQGLPAAGGGSAYRAMTAAPHGVYFLNRRGIWLTTGGPPQLVSDAIEPLFRGQGVSAFWQGGYLNQAQISLCAIHWHDNRLYFAYPSGSQTFNDKLIVHDPSRQSWVLWDIPAAALCSFRVGNNEDLMFGYATGTVDIGRHNSSFTDDAGTAITSRYRSGFSDLGKPADRRKRVRQWKLKGSSGAGTVGFSVAADNATAIPTTGGGAKAQVALADPGYYRVAQRGRDFSWQIETGGTTRAWVPTDVTGCERWYAARVETAYSDNQAVPTATDQTGGANATQGTGSKQPLYKTGIQNGLAGYLFDGTDDEMSAALSADSTRTIFVVAKQTANTADKGCIGNTAGGAGLQNNAATQWGYYINQASAVENIGGTPTNCTVLAVRWNSTSSADSFVNGGAAHNFDPADSYSTATTLWLGALDTGFRNWNGYLFEVIYYNSALSGTDLDTVRNFLGATYSLGFGSIPSPITSAGGAWRLDSVVAEVS